MSSFNSVERCAVIGQPISHSLSPEIHGYFASQFDMDLEYQRIEGADQTFADQVLDFFQSGGRGMNVTTPFKSAACHLADQVSDMSRLADSCNTLYMHEGQLLGTTTDGSGWLADCNRLGIDIGGKRLLMLGAGGASRILFHSLMALAEPPETLVIANRTVSKIEDLGDYPGVIPVALDEIPALDYDLVINGLSVGWQNKFPGLDVQLAEKCHAYDLNYGQGARPFHRWAMRQGASKDYCHDGWGMLVNQAALSFEIWWGKHPQTRQLIEAGAGYFQERS